MGEYNMLIKWVLVCLSCLFAACCSISSYVKDNELERSLFEHRAYVFGSEEDRQIVFDFRHMRSFTRGSHSGSLIIDCTTDEIHCFMGTILIMVPKLCSSNFSDAELSEAYSVIKVGPANKNGEQAIRTVARSDLHSWEEDNNRFSGIIFHRSKGVTAIWQTDSLSVDAIFEQKLELQGDVNLLACKEHT